MALEYETTSRTCPSCGSAVYRKVIRIGTWQGGENPQTTRLPVRQPVRLDRELVHAQRRAC